MFYSKFNRVRWRENYDKLYDIIKGLLNDQCMYSRLRLIRTKIPQRFCVNYRVPTAPGKPGKMTTVFPVLEKYWNFIILLTILEKWEWTWKNELSGEKIVLSWLLQHSFLLYRALPIKMYIWEKFWDSWASVVFSDGRVYGAIRLDMLLDSKKGDRASAISCPQCV